MSAIAARLGGLSVPRLADGYSQPLQLVAFAALAGWGSLHWAGLVQGSGAGRALAELGVACAAAALLVLLARAPVAAPLRHVLATVIAAVTVGVGLVVAGLPAGLLKPARWDELGDGLDRGLAGVRTVDWPYAGGEEWIRLVILLGAPLLLGLAAALAFWPTRRFGSLLRGLGLALLLVLYGTAVTEHDPGAPLLRGLVLLGLVAAWLWLPRLRPREAGPAAALVLAVGIAALPVAGWLDSDRPWWDYKEWHWFGGGKTLAFNWDHSYGPLDWPRDGTTLLNVKSDRPHYWKTETLDRFDGFRWLRSDRNDFARPLAELPEPRNPRWDERIHFTVRALRTNFVVGAGTPYEVTGIDNVVSFADGTARKLDEPLERGDSYDVRAYAPNPSADEMRAAGYDFGLDLLQYTEFYLPNPNESALEGSGRPSEAARGPEIDRLEITMPLVGQPDTGTSGADRLLRESPYGPMYRRALALTDETSSVYQAVKNVEQYLQETFEYSERVPSQEYPLAAFMFEDRRGYCQQFSGAMALMLRMVGIPARVSAGFSPGSYNRDSKEWRVRDLDAHSWVEVRFPDIGWVPFDPTPSIAPPESQSGGAEATSAARADAPEALRGTATPASDRSLDPTGGLGSDGGEEARLWLIPVVLVALGLAWTGLLLLLERRRQRRLAPGERLDVQLRELERALRRLGWEMPVGTTLLQLERRLGRAVGPAAGHYAARLRAHRFAPATPPAPGGADRRALRRELSAHSGPFARLRGYLALPPLGPRAGRADS